MMVATAAESVHEQGLPGGVDVVAVERDWAAEAAGGRRKGSTSEGAARAYGAGRAAKKKAPPRPEARTEFRGVSRTLAGNYGARIDHSKGQKRWLGTFDTAEEAARAYDEAAVRLHGARAVTNYEQDGVSGSVGRAAAKKKKPAAPRPDARTEFVGVSRQPNGKYVAGLWDSGRRKVVTVGRFDTAEEAAGAYDAAAVGMYGAAARTNFEAAAADDGDMSSVDLLSDFPEPPACNVRSDSIIPGPALDDLRTDADLTPAERQQVDEFLIDMDFADVVD
uniref:AP2/ERF domain-containing protein n=1 Tax=Aegilops tauschii subsp. strangulata TaxID=200361 RepID=A0A453NDU8_AEGTS